MLAAMTKTAAAAAVTALMLTLTACGGNDDDEQAAAAISDSIMEGQNNNGDSGNGMFEMKRAEADCIGNGFVEEIGTEKLQEYGFITEDLEAEGELGDVQMAEPDASAAADSLFECTDVSTMMKEALASSGQMDAKTQACLEDALTEERLKNLFTLLFSGKEEQANQSIMEPMTECITAAQQ
jgi:hypothetical protein